MNFNLPHGHWVLIDAMANYLRLDGVSEQRLHTDCLWYRLISLEGRCFDHRRVRWPSGTRSIY